MTTEQLVIDKIFLNNLKLAQYVTLEFRSEALRNTLYSSPSASGKVNFILNWNDSNTKANCNYTENNITGIVYYPIYAEDSKEEILHPNDYLHLNLSFSAQEIKFLAHILQKDDKLSFVVAIDQNYDVYVIDLRFTIERKKEIFQLPLTLLRKNVFNGNVLNYR